MCGYDSWHASWQVASWSYLPDHSIIESTAYHPHKKITGRRKRFSIYLISCNASHDRKNNPRFRFFMYFYFQDGTQEVILLNQIPWPENIFREFITCQVWDYMTEKIVWEFIWKCFCEDGIQEGTPQPKDVHRRTFDIPCFMLQLHRCPAHIHKWNSSGLAWWSNRQKAPCLSGNAAHFVGSNLSTPDSCALSLHCGSSTRGARQSFLLHQMEETPLVCIFCAGKPVHCRNGCRHTASWKKGTREKL